LELFQVVLNQNYFQYDGKLFKLIRGIAMGSRVSGVVAELYLQYFEELSSWHRLENGEILY
jgi:hypothetical protein